MKIAIPVTSNNQIDDHFGHCEYFNVFSISENNELIDLQTLKSESGCGCKSNIAGTLAEQGVSVMLAGGIGAGAISVLNNAGIEVVRGCSGDSIEAVNLFLSGKIIDNGTSCHHPHHHHSEGHEHICNH